MALSATVVVNVRNGGSDTNGGGFKTGASGTDWTQQDSPQYSVTDGVTNGTTTITSATAAFGTDVVGGLVCVSGGTGSITKDWYEITSRTNSTTIVVDRSTGLTTGTGVTLKIGGALASPGMAGFIKAKTAGIRIMIKYNATAYTLTGSTANTSGGPIDDTAGGVDGGDEGGIFGYDTTFSPWNTDANRPTISAGSVTGLSNGIIKLSAGYVPSTVANLILDCNNGASNAGVVLGANTRYKIYRCHGINCKGGFVYGASSSDGTVVACSSTGHSGVAAFYSANPSVMTCKGCHAYSGTIHGFQGDYADVYILCVSNANSGASTDGFNRAVITTDSPIYMFGCISHGNGRHGFFFGGNNRSQLAEQCVATANGAYGFAASATTTVATLLRCATYNNTSGATNNIGTNAQVGMVTLTGDPWTNASSHNFTTNATAGAGAALRALGTDLAPSLAGTDYRDTGTFQHQDSGGGGGGALVFDFGFNGGFGS